MRYLWLPFLFLLVGCQYHDAEKHSLDSFLSNGVNRIEFVSPHGVATNVVAGQQMNAMLAMLGASNRVDKAVAHKSTYGEIVLCRGSEHVILTYFFSQRVFSFRGYQFRLRSTNEMREFFAQAP